MCCNANVKRIPVIFNDYLTYLAYQLLQKSILYFDEVYIVHEFTKQ